MLFSPGYITNATGTTPISVGDNNDQTFPFILVLKDMARLLTIVTKAKPEDKTNRSPGSGDSTNQVTCYDTEKGTYNCEGSLEGQYKRNSPLRKLTTF